MGIIWAYGLILRALRLVDATGAPVRERALVGLVPDPHTPLRMHPLD